MDIPVMEIDGVIENDNGGEPVGDTALMKKSIGNSRMNLHLYRKKSGRNTYINYVNHLQAVGFPVWVALYEQVEKSRLHERDLKSPGQLTAK